MSQLTAPVLTGLAHPLARLRSGLCSQRLRLLLGGLPGGGDPLRVGRVRHPRVSLPEPDGGFSNSFAGKPRYGSFSPWSSSPSTLGATGPCCRSSWPPSAPAPEALACFWAPPPGAPSLGVAVIMSLGNLRYKGLWVAFGLFALCRPSRGAGAVGLVSAGDGRGVPAGLLRSRSDGALQRHHSDHHFPDRLRGRVLRLPADAGRGRHEASGRRSRASSPRLWAPP